MSDETATILVERVGPYGVLCNKTWFGLTSNSKLTPKQFIEGQAYEVTLFYAKSGKAYISGVISGNIAAPEVSAPAPKPAPAPVVEAVEATVVKEEPAKSVPVAVASQAVTITPTDSKDLEGSTLVALITSGDMSGLDNGKKVAYYKARCEAAGLDPRTAPFQFIRLQGKEILYATKGATDQLCKVHRISVDVLEQKTEGDLRVVLVRAKTGDGRHTDELGVVPVAGLKGGELANALMKALTKAKRRAILSLCGLGMMDETELETVPGVTAAPLVVTPEVVDGKTE